MRLLIFILLSLALNLSAHQNGYIYNEMFVPTDLGTINLTLFGCDIKLPEKLQAVFTFHAYATDSNQAEDHQGCWMLTEDGKEIRIYYPEIKGYVKYEADLFELKPTV